MWSSGQKKIQARESCDQFRVSLPDRLHQVFQGFVHFTLAPQVAKLSKLYLLLLNRPDSLFFFDKRTCLKKEKMKEEQKSDESEFDFFDDE